MQELIALSQSQIGDETTQSVNARDLYEVLELDKSNWSRWAKKNLTNNEFALEGVDYQGFVIMTNGNETTDYALTLDFAKKLAMQVKTAVGEKIRDYFLECEKQAFSVSTSLPDFSDPRVMLAFVSHMDEKVKTLTHQVEESKEKVDAFDRISTADGSLCITDAAKALQMRPKDLFSYLREHGWIYKRTGGANYLGYQRLVASGMLEHKVTTVLRGDGSEKVTEQVRITPKGLAKLSQLIKPVAVAA